MFLSLLLYLVMIPLDWATQYLETILIDLNDFKIEMLDILVFNPSFGPDI